MTTLSAPKLCVECIHIRPGDIPMMARCGSPENIRLNLVVGGVEPRFTFCDIARHDDTACGRAAKWFAPKIPAVTLPEQGIDRLNGMDAYYMHDMPEDDMRDSCDGEAPGNGVQHV